MNIFSFAQKSTDEKFVGSMRRSTAATIDLWIVLIMRIFVMQLLGSSWMNREVANFTKDFQETFGTEEVKKVPEHIDFIIHHRLFLCALIFYVLIIFVGALYHALLNSSAWQGTVGKRFMKVMIIKNSGEKISFYKALSHYFLSVLPFAYILFLITYQMTHGLTLYQAITASPVTVFLGFVFIIWVQMHLFTKKKTTAYDLICDTILVKGKTEAKYPWSKH